MFFENINTKILWKGISDNFFKWESFVSLGRCYCRSQQLLQVCCMDRVGCWASSSQVSPTVIFSDPSPPHPLITLGLGCLYQWHIHIRDGILLDIYNQYWILDILWMGCQVVYSKIIINTIYMTMSHDDNHYMTVFRNYRDPSPNMPYQLCTGE